MTFIINPFWNAGAGGASFDPLTNSALVALSNSNFTATRSAGADAYGGAKALAGKKTGKWYFEASLDTKVADDTNFFNTVGLMRTDMQYKGAAFYRLGATVQLNRTTVGRFYVDRATSPVDLGVPANADRFGIAVDLGAALIWARRNNGSWNASGGADPASGTGGVSLGDLTGYALTPFATFYHATEALTLKTGSADLAYGVPVGFTAGWDSASPLDNSGGGYTTFNSVKNENMTLSGSDLTATRNTSSALAKSRDPKGEGKQYLEFTANTWGGSADGIGFCEPDAVYLDVINSTKSAIVYKGGTIWIDGSYSGTTLGAVANGDRLDAAIDWTNQNVWFRKNGGNWNANGAASPATNVGGISFTKKMAVPCAILGSTGSTAGNNTTMNAGATGFSGAVPSGFESGWDREANP